MAASNADSDEGGVVCTTGDDFNVDCEGGTPAGTNGSDGVPIHVVVISPSMALTQQVYQTLTQQPLSGQFDASLSTPVRVRYKGASYPIVLRHYHHNPPYSTGKQCRPSDMMLVCYTGTETVPQVRELIDAYDAAAGTYDDDGASAEQAVLFVLCAGSVDSAMGESTLTMLRDHVKNTRPTASTAVTMITYSMQDVGSWTAYATDRLGAILVKLGVAAGKITLVDSPAEPTSSLCTRAAWFIVAAFCWSCCPSVRRSQWQAVNQTD